MRFLPVLLAAVFFTVFSISTATATMITAGKDAYIQSGAANANINFGSAILDQIKRQDGSAFTRKSYFGFDLSGLPAAPIATATFNLNFVDSRLGSTAANLVYGFELFGLTNQALDGWGESTITWNNAPANQANNLLNAAMVTSLGTFNLTGKGLGVYNFSSQALVDFLNSDTNDLATLILLRTTNQPNGHNYVHAIASREHGAVAGASLAITAVPEPSTLLLVGAGLASLGIIHRRRKS